MNMPFKCWRRTCVCQLARALRWADTSAPTPRTIYLLHWAAAEGLPEREGSRRRHLLAVLTVPGRPHAEPAAHPTFLRQEPWNFYGFNCDRMSHSYARHRWSEMFSNLSFQGDLMLLHGLSFAPPNPKGRQTQSQGVSEEGLQLFKVHYCNINTGSHTHANL